MQQKISPSPFAFLGLFGVLFSMLILVQYADFSSAMSENMLEKTSYPSSTPDAKSEKPQYYTVRGEVTDVWGSSLEQTKVQIIGGETAFDVPVAEDGQYVLDQLNPNNDYEISISKQVESDRRLNVLDLSLVYHQVKNKRKLTPAAAIAADVNQDQNIDESDLRLLSERLLGDDQNKALAWKFYQTSNHLNLNKAPQTLSLADLSKDHDKANFMGVAIGDIKGTQFKPDHNHKRTKIQLEVEDIHFEEGDIVEVPVILASQMKTDAFQLSFMFSETVLSFLDFDTHLHADMSLDNADLLKSGHGDTWKMVTVLDREELFMPHQKMATLVFRAKTAGKLSQCLFFGSQALPAIWIEQGKKPQTFQLQFRSAEQMAKLQNKPNPFNDFTTLTFSLPEEDVVTYTLKDITGKVFCQSKIACYPGKNEITINSNQLQGHAGIFYCELQGAIFDKPKVIRMLKLN